MKLSSLILASFFAGVCVVQQANASLITMDISQTISGNPEGSALQADFEDNGAPGSVTLTVRAVNLSGDEFMSDLYFNLDPAMDPAKLQFGSPVIGGDFAAPTIHQGSNSQKAGGDGYYDLEFEFATAQADRFIANNIYQITVTSTDPITAGSFNFPSSVDKNGNSDTPYYSAAHLQSFDNNGTKSVWTGSFNGTVVPEPSTIVLALLGMAGLGLLYRH